MAAIQVFSNGTVPIATIGLWAIRERQERLEPPRLPKRLPCQAGQTNHVPHQEGATGDARDRLASKDDML